MEKIYGSQVLIKMARNSEISTRADLSHMKGETPDLWTQTGPLGKNEKAPYGYYPEGYGTYSPKKEKYPKWRTDSPSQNMVHSPHPIPMGMGPNTSPRKGKKGRGRGKPKMMASPPGRGQKQTPRPYYQQGGMGEQHDPLQGRYRPGYPFMAPITNQRLIPEPGFQIPQGMYSMHSPNHIQRRDMGVGTSPPYSPRGQQMQPERRWPSQPPPPPPPPPHPPQQCHPTVGCQTSPHLMQQYQPPQPPPQQQMMMTMPPPRISSEK